MNITGKINRSSIVDCPETATIVSVVAQNKIQLFYRYENIKYNDGTNKDVLQYRSFTGFWVNSGLTEQELQELEFKIIED